MARKSSWQQFSDNFSSVYGTFQDFGRDINAAAIMDEEVEVIQAPDASENAQYQGLASNKFSSPHAGGDGMISSGSKFRYDGKSYDQQLSPEKLRGLRNQRLFDNMVKFGDTEGAMKMQALQAGIENTTANTENLQQKTNLAIAQFPDLAKKIGYENLGLQAGTALNLAQKEKILRMLPHEERYAASQLVNLNWDNKYLSTTFDSRVKIKGEEAKQSEITTSEAEITNNFNKDEEVIKSKKDTYLSNNKLTQSDNTLGLAKNTVETGEVEEQQKVNDMMVEYRNNAKDGMYDGENGDELSKKFLVDSLMMINPILAKEMKNNYTATQITEITQKSTMFKTAAMEAFESGGIEGVAKAIDDLNGVNNTSFTVDPNGFHVLNETDPETNKIIRQIAKGNSAEEFSMNLQKALDPARSMEISKEYMDNLKLQADTGYTNAMTEKVLAETKAAGKPPPLGKDEYFVAMMLDNDPSNDEQAMQGLYGMEMTRDEISQMVTDAAFIKEKNKIETVAPGEDKDGLTNVPVETPVRVSGTMGVTKTQIDPTASLNEQNLQKIAAAQEINEELWGVFNVIKRDYVKWTHDRNLSAPDLKKQKRRDAAVSWLRNNWEYFQVNPTQLADFKKDPEGWVEKNSTGLAGD